MALPRQVTSVVFNFVGIKETSVKPQDVNIEVTPEYFSGSSYKETIGAKRISDIRGFRVKVTLNYQASNQADTYQSLFNDMLEAFRDGTVGGTSFTSLQVKVNGTSLGQNFILEDLSYTQTYRNQIGRFIPSVVVCSEGLISTIPDTLEGIL